MVKNEDGTSSLSEDSIAKLQLKEKDSLKIASTADTNTDDDYYEVEKVLRVRLNKQFHSEEYKVRFKGYTSDDDMWLPSSAFKEPVTFHTVSKRGRLRKHRMKEGSSAPETQGNNPRRTPTETNLKRKYVHELKTEEYTGRKKIKLLKEDSTKDGKGDKERGSKRKKDVSCSAKR
ncbi:uncharacterized protein [Porites lutea]